jgi:hypothetical protein
MRTFLALAAAEQESDRAASTEAVDEDCRPVTVHPTPSSEILRAMTPGAG